jgi:mRNA-degrading endonuclease toxin of MazEF toxin-antitoxin module
VRNCRPFSNGITTDRPAPLKIRKPVAPVISTIRGVPSEDVLEFVRNEDDGMKSPCAVNLQNAVTVSQQRLGKCVVQLSAARMNEVCASLRFSLGCDSARQWARSVCPRSQIIPEFRSYRSLPLSQPLLLYCFMEKGVIDSVAQVV